MDIMPARLLSDSGRIIEVMTIRSDSPALAAVRRSWATAVVLSVCSLLVAGCDPVRSTSQAVRIAVVDTTRGQPVAGASVALLVADASGERSPSEAEPTAEEWKNRIEANPALTFQGVTDKQGVAAIYVRYTSIDRTWGSKPLPSKDIVTAHRYLIKVADGKVHDELIHLVMEAEASTKGRTFTVTVLSIAQPQYVEVK
jgi:hypothetical protein